MKVAIIRYNAGNTESVANALARLGIEPTLTDSPEAIAAADRVIFPGVGEASTAMDYLRRRRLDVLIPALTQPVLGICLGMQLLCSRSEEGDTECLGVVDSTVRRFESDTLKVPHIGWNRIRSLTSPLFRGIDEGVHMYFVHGYYVEFGPATTATCEYAGDFSAAVQSRNFHAVQFHPEKSGIVGERILRNFLEV